MIKWKCNSTSCTADKSSNESSSFSRSIVSSAILSTYSWRHLWDKWSLSGSYPSWSRIAFFNLAWVTVSFTEWVIDCPWSTLKQYTETLQLFCHIQFICSSTKFKLFEPWSHIVKLQKIRETNVTHGHLLSCFSTNNNSTNNSLIINTEGNIYIQSHMTWRAVVRVQLVSMQNGKNIQAYVYACVHAHSLFWKQFQ